MLERDNIELLYGDGDRPPPTLEGVSADGSGSERDHAAMARIAVYMRAYHGHIISLFRAAAEFHDPADVRLGREPTVEAYAQDIVDYFASVRSVENAAKFEMMFTWARDAIETLLADEYFRARTHDSAPLRDCGDVYARLVDKLADTRVGQPNEVAALKTGSAVEEILRLDPEFLAGYTLDVQEYWFRILAASQSVLADFLSDMDRVVGDIGVQHEDLPVVEAVELKSGDNVRALREVFLVWRNGGDLVGVWDDIDLAEADTTWVPVWAQTEGTD